jgi:hypothetical protein
MADKKLCPLSLTQYFDAPPDYRGIFGWVCGYSADPLFLNDAAERFTRETSRGIVSLALMLDPGQPAITPVEVPGVAHLPIKNASKRPFRLLHAKVALLGFRHESEAENWLIRLIVSTGNWTRQTLEESLDLAWCIEVTANELDVDDDDLELRCADLTAAWSLFTFLHGLFDLRLLDAATERGHSETHRARNNLDTWMDKCKTLAGANTRFLDNRNNPFLSQLSSAIKTVNGASKRNYLAMGSGFYESQNPKAAAVVPAVLDRIVSELIRAGMLTKSAGVDLFINPVACQAVASSLKAITQHGWKVRPASKMDSVFGPNSQRSLHAKFLFSAHEKEGNNVCQRPWVYLGSGNLTGPGFASLMSHNGGNLEAGVVFTPDNLEWYDRTRVDPKVLVTNLLPIQWDKEFGQGDTLSPGAAMPPPSKPFVAPPIPWLEWHPAESGSCLNVPAGSLAECEVLDTTGQPCARHGKGFCWPGSKPRQVRVRWMDEELVHECFIPVMDEFGRLAATELTDLDFDEVWWALAGFPAAGDDRETGDEDDPEPRNSVGSARGGDVATYPVRQMMELVERIAAQQTAVLPADWAAWCARLEQTLSRVAESPVLAYFRTLGLNPLSPLRASPFRPAYAETAKSSEGQLYEAVLSRIEKNWQTASLMAFGEEEA